MSKQPKNYLEHLKEHGHTPKRTLDVIRERCLYCKENDVSAVSSCQDYKCPSYPYRFGGNPWRKKPDLTAAEKTARQERMAHARKYRHGIDPFEEAADKAWGPEKPKSKSI